MKLNKKLTNESFFGGYTGFVGHTRKNLGLNEADPAVSGLPSRVGVPDKQVAPAKPTPKPAPKPQQRPQQKPIQQNNPTQEPHSTDYSLNYKVSSGYKVKFEGKPGDYYIVRIMDKAMKNFLVANKTLGIKQFYNVRVESIISDEHNKPYPGAEEQTSVTPVTPQEAPIAESKLLLKNILNEKMLNTLNKKKLSKQQKKEMLEAIRKFNSYSDRIYRSHDLSEMVNDLSNMIKSANELAMNESDGFDGITVSRHMKGLQNNFQLFEKTASELGQLQERLEHLYEDMGSILSRYYDIADNGKLDNSSPALTEDDSPSYWPEEDDDDVITIDPDTDHEEEIAIPSPSTKPTKKPSPLLPKDPEKQPDPKPMDEKFIKRIQHIYKKK